MTSHYTRDGIKVSLLGYGAMRLPTVDGQHANAWVKEGYSASAIDQTLLNRQVKQMLDGGITYFDTSPAYCRGESETALGAALKASGYPRKAYAIATKLSNFAPQQYPLAACKEMFARSLAALQTDYVDYYLLHSIGNGKGMSAFRARYLDNGALDWCVELRKQGKIRNLGFSYHGDSKTLEWCLAHHDKYHWDFVQIQMNYVDWRHAQEVNPRNLNAEYLYGELSRREIPVVIMEPLLGGRLARYNYALAQVLSPLNPEATLAEWAFRFCGSFPKVLTVLSGMTRTEHIEENLATFSPLKTCSPREFDALEHAARNLLAVNMIPCTACNYCMPCPYGLDIPAIFASRNAVLATPPARATLKDRLLRVMARQTPAAHAAREVLKAYAAAVPEELRRADHCTGCGRCTSHCPQSIDIPKELAMIDEWIDNLKDQVVAK